MGHGRSPGTCQRSVPEDRGSGRGLAALMISWIVSIELMKGGAGWRANVPLVIDISEVSGGAVVTIQLHNPVG